MEMLRIYFTILQESEVSGQNGYMKIDLSSNWKYT